jgi:hypothetical protein
MELRGNSDLSRLGTGTGICMHWMFTEFGGIPFEKWEMSCTFGSICLGAARIRPYNLT